MLHLITMTAVLILVSATSIASSGATPRNFVSSLESDVRAMLAIKDVARANAIFAENIDMSVFSKRCLIDHWDEFSPDERLRFQDLLERNIKKTMTEKTLIVPDDTNFRLVPKTSKVEDGLVRIDNSLYVRGNDVSLGIFLVKRGNAYRVADYEFEGALLSRNYQGQFNYLIRKYGKAGFFDRLERKVEIVAEK